MMFKVVVGLSIITLLKIISGFNALSEKENSRLWVKIKSASFFNSSKFISLTFVIEILH